MNSLLQKNHYERLGVSRKATPQEIRLAFRKLAKVYHPDIAEDKAQAKEVFILLNEAQQTLFDANKRKSYDMSLHIGRTRNPWRS